MNTEVRKGQAPDRLSREAFGECFRRRFDDPALGAEADAIGHEDGGSDGPPTGTGRGARALGEQAGGRGVRSLDR